MAEPNLDKSATAIADLVVRPDFPECAVGETIDIGGFTGTVIEIVHNSIKVKTPEGSTRSFNFHTLRKLYGPPVEIPPLEREQEREQARPADPASSSPTETPEIEPNFDQPAKLIADVVKQPGFPQSALGQLIDIAGYLGVVVQIVNQSLKVRSRHGASRKYNAETLKRLHGKP